MIFINFKWGRLLKKAKQKEPNKAKDDKFNHIKMKNVFMNTS